MEPRRAPQSCQAQDTPDTPESSVGLLRISSSKNQTCPTSLIHVPNSSAAEGE